jgi:predicted DsbA family dithiol-disulfide isomerase
VSNPPPIEVTEYTDPFCVWAWGSEPKLRRFRVALDGQVSWRRVQGVLYDAAADLPGDPGTQIADQFERWADVVRHTDGPLPARLEWPVASSRPAALAAKAAERQGSWLADRVVRRLRESLFLAGRPAVDEETIAEAVDGIAGLDAPALLADLHSDEVRQALAADWEETRNPVPAVIGLTEPMPHPGAAAPDGDRTRYRFPTLLVHGPAGSEAVPGWRPFASYIAAVHRVAPGVEIGDGTMGSADDAALLFDSLTAAELEALTSGAGVPSTGTRLEGVRGTVWASTERAALLRKGVLSV